jgi:cell division protein ZapB
MSQNDKQGIQEQELRALEVRVEELIRACLQLKDENKTLRAREQELLDERERLSQKNTQARARVEDIIHASRATRGRGVSKPSDPVVSSRYSARNTASAAIRAPSRS